MRTPVRRPPPALLVLVVAAPALSCGGGALSEQAVATFVRAYPCEKENIVVAERDPTPPGDIASDPDKLVVWKQGHPAGTYFMVEGCGQSRSVSCVTGECRIESR